MLRSVLTLSLIGLANWFLTDAANAQQYRPYNPGFGQRHYGAPQGYQQHGQYRRYSGRPMYGSGHGWQGSSRGSWGRWSQPVFQEDFGFGVDRPTWGTPYASGGWYNTPYGSVTGYGGDTMYPTPDPRFAHSHSMGLTQAPLPHFQGSIEIKQQPSAPPQPVVPEPIVEEPEVPVAESPGTAIQPTVRAPTAAIVWISRARR